MDNFNRVDGDKTSGEEKEDNFNIEEGNNENAEEKDDNFKGGVRRQEE